MYCCSVTMYFFVSFQNDTFSSTEQVQGSHGSKLSVRGGQSSNQPSAERKPCGTMKVILCAFIEPAHWGKAYDANFTVEVRSDLGWDKGCVDVRLSR